MALSSFFRALTSRSKSQPITRDARRYRPTLELLEDRLAPAIFTVTSAADAGANTLRAAILSANALAGPDTINFNIAVLGVATINLASPLPTLTGAVTIAGNTQPGFGGIPLIELNGTSAGAGANGLVMKAPGSVVRALTINRFQGNGILALGANGVVEACYIGTNIVGAVAQPNQFNGVLISGLATNVRIGGTTVAARNIISGNALNGVAILGALTSAHKIQGNFIGTDVGGTVDLGNTGDGVLISDGSDLNVIGGTVAGTRNIISGNNSDGVEISGPGATGNLVQGNFIGTDVTAALARGNSDGGVRIAAGAANNTIGGTVAAARNILSGNTDFGVEISGAGTTGNKVQGNFIGTNATGTATILNNQGVFIAGGAANNTVGGPAAGARNVISGNNNGGVIIAGAGTTGNLVQGNFIGTDVTGNAGLNTNNKVQIFFGAANNTVGGTVAAARNIISGNSHVGVEIHGVGTTGNFVQGNFIGTNAAGTADLGNTQNGVAILFGASNNTVGGTVAGARNVISGNNNDGVQINGAGTTGNLVQGNFIGTNAAGNAALGNSGAGVVISSAPNNTIGGTAAGTRNLISGNGSAGVRIEMAANKVQGNFIGTDITGNSALGNAGDGVLLSDADGTLVGGAVAAARNVISGNLVDGVRGSSSQSMKIQGNFIGTNVLGTADLGNLGDGVDLNNNSNGNDIGGTLPGERNVISGNAGNGVAITGNQNDIWGNFIGTSANGTAPLGNTQAGVIIEGGSLNRIGGTQAGAGNRIAHNGGDGVGIDPTFPDKNAVLGNSIFNNGGLGIDLGDDGPTANDTNDPDTGANDLLNTPVITNAYLTGTSLLLMGSINTEINKVLRIEFFASPTGGQGQTFLGFLNVTMTANTVTFAKALTVPASVLVGHKVTATITDELGNTSEFSIPTTIE